MLGGLCELLGKTPKQIGDLEDNGDLEREDKIFLYAYMGWKQLDDYKKHGFEIAGF